MAESRYAPGRSWQLCVHFSDRPELHHVFFDVTAEGPVPSYPIASVLNCYSPFDVDLGLCVASRWVIRDAALASMREAIHGLRPNGGPSP